MKFTIPQKIHLNFKNYQDYDHYTLFGTKKVLENLKKTASSNPKAFDGSQTLYNPSQYTHRSRTKSRARFLMKSTRVVSTKQTCTRLVKWKMTSLCRFLHFYGATLTSACLKYAHFKNVVCCFLLSIYIDQCCSRFFFRRSPLWFGPCLEKSCINL